MDPDGYGRSSRARSAKLGFDDEQARIGAEVLVRTDLRGHHTHGTRICRLRAADARRGDPDRCEAGNVRETVSTAVLDAKHGMGHVIDVPGDEVRDRQDPEDRKWLADHTCLVRESNHFGRGSRPLFAR